MSRRSRFKKKKNNIYSIVINMSMVLLLLLLFGFLSSSINRLFFNNGNKLSSLPKLEIGKYEEKTGHKIQLEIWNGCGISNLALMYSDYLRSEGFDVLESKNANHFNYLETIIFYHRGDRERAEELANTLKINKNNIKEKINNNLFYDLTLIIGKDYISLPSYRNAVLFQPPF